MKLVILGGGGFRTPVIYRAIASGATRTRYSEIVLYDIDRNRLRRVERVLEGMDREAGHPVPYRSATQLDDAVDGADVVYCAVRVGGMEGRLVDETAAIGAGAIGQETTGAGGITFALRTVPAVLDIARVVAIRAPDATFINFTNPVGLVTEALRTVLGDRVVGICDAPPDLCKRVALAVGYSFDELYFDYFGINHLGWLRGVFRGGVDLLPGLLADDERLMSFEEGRLFGAERIRAIGMIPNEYLFYYYAQAQALAAMSAGLVRADYLRRQQAAFFAADGTPEETLTMWEATMAEREERYMAEAWRGREDELRQVAAQREPGGYGALALGIVDALGDERPTTIVLNVANRSSLPCFDAGAVVEVPCVVSRGGIVPVATGAVPIEAEGLMLLVRAAERVAIQAAREGSRRLAVRALAMHPLVPSMDAAHTILDTHLGAMPELAATIR